jgi:hypothetical protein
MRETINNLPASIRGLLPDDATLAETTFEEMEDLLRALPPQAYKAAMRRIGAASGASGEAARLQLVDMLEDRGFQTREQAIAYAASLGDRGVQRALERGISQIISSGSQAQFRFNDRAVKYAKQVSEINAGGDAAVRALAALRALPPDRLRLLNVTQDIPGSVVPPDIAHARQLVAMAAAPYRHELFGSAFTTEEARAWQVIAGGGLLDRPEQAISFLETRVRSSNKARKAVDDAYPDVLSGAPIVGRRQMDSPPGARSGGSAPQQRAPAQSVPETGAPAPRVQVVPPDVEDQWIRTMTGRP